MEWHPDGELGIDQSGRERLRRILNASLPLFRTYGIAIRLHWSFFLFALIFSGWNARLLAGAGGHSAAALVLWGLVQAALLYFALILPHELGHAAMAILKGGSCERITLTPLGGLAHVGGAMRNPGMEAEVTLAGPGVSLLILGVSMAFVSMFGMPTGWRPFTLSGALGFLFWTNVALVVFNLLPAFPMDGGRILRAYLSWRRGPRAGTRIACRVGQVMAVAFVGAGIWRIASGGFWGWLLIGIGVSNLIACSAALRYLHAGFPVYEQYVPERRILQPSRSDRRELKRKRKDAAFESRMDDLLDKVSKEGIGSLTFRERRFLRQASKRVDKRRLH